MRVVLACAVEPPASADLDTVEGHAWADARRQLDEISAGRANGAASDTVLTKPTPLGLLLIDDDEFVLDCFLVLAKHSHPLWQVRTAPDHAAGLGIAREFMPQVISTGVVNMRKPGLSFGRSIRQDKQLKNIFLIAVTGCDASSMAEIDNAGFDVYLNKPVEYKLFIQHIQAFALVRSLLW